MWKEQWSGNSNTFWSMIHYEAFLCPSFLTSEMQALPAVTVFDQGMWLQLCISVTCLAHVLSSQGDCLIMMRISRFGCDWEGQQEIHMPFHSAHAKSVPWKARPQGLSLTGLSQGPHAVLHLLCLEESWGAPFTETWGAPFTENVNGVLLESANIQALASVSSTHRLVSKVEYST